MSEETEPTSVEPETDIEAPPLPEPLPPEGVPEDPPPPPPPAVARYFVDAQGAFLGTFVGAEPEEGAIEVSHPPASGRQLWDFADETWLSLQPDAAELTAHFVQAVSVYMDQAAQERRYDGILSLCTYATSTDATFAAEGQAGVDFRDTCWRYCYDTLAEVQAGKRPAPELEAFLGELPRLTWPAASTSEPAKDAPPADQVDESVPAAG